MNAKHLINTLQLQPHPEGGYFKETYRSPQTMQLDQGRRNVCTTIYYLLENADQSALHRIKSDELWFFHAGQPLEIVYILEGAWKTILLGNDLATGEIPQACIPANCWFGARIKNGSGFSLVSCTVSPGFDFADFELAEREELIAAFPDLKDKIIAFTR